MEIYFLNWIVRNIILCVFLVLFIIVHVPRASPVSVLEKEPLCNVIAFILRHLFLLYNFTSVYTNISSCRRDESKTNFPLQEGIFIYSRVLVQ